MEITFRQINMDDDFELCVASRKDAYFCSFGHYDGFEDFISGYRERVSERLSTSGWFYIHIFVDGEFAGQLEFRSFRRAGHGLCAPYLSKTEFPWSRACP